MMPLLIMKLSENKFKAQADKPVHCSYVLLYITTAEVSYSVYFWWNGRSSAARMLWKHIEAADFFFLWILSYINICVTLQSILKQHKLWRVLLFKRPH